MAEVVKVGVSYEEKFTLSTELRFEPRVIGGWAEATVEEGDDWESVQARLRTRITESVREAVAIEKKVHREKHRGH